MRPYRRPNRPFLRVIEMPLSSAPERHQELPCRLRLGLGLGPRLGRDAVMPWLGRDAVMPWLGRDAVMPWLGRDAVMPGLGGMP